MFFARHGVTQRKGDDMLDLNVTQMPVRNQSGRGSTRKEGICLHHWVAMWTNARMRDFSNNPNSRASYHVGLDVASQVAQFIPFTMASWSVIGHNSRLVNVGVANSELRAPWPISQRNLEMLPRVLAWVSLQCGFGELVLGRNFWLHRNLSATECPGRFITDRINTILAEANRLIRANGNITPPTQSTNTTYHIVRQGETLSSIARDRGVTVAQLVAWNCIPNPNMIRPGDRIAVRLGVSPPTIQAPPTPPTVSIDTLARQVIAGQWGNGQDRVNRLRAAGHDPVAVQNRVNQLLR